MDIQDTAQRWESFRGRRGMDNELNQEMERKMGE
jgi:hypothetical protein